MRAPARSQRPAWPGASHISSFCFSFPVLRLGAITSLPHSQVVKLERGAVYSIEEQNNTGSLVL